MAYGLLQVVEFIELPIVIETRGDVLFVSAKDIVIALSFFNKYGCKIINNYDNFSIIFEYDELFEALYKP
jgi:hypothetical protein